MRTKVLSPTNDAVFKMLFGSDRHTDILSSFLKTVLLLPNDVVSKVAIQTTFQEKELPRDKTSILDVLVTTASGRSLDIEIQVVKRPALAQRILFYAARLISTQLKEGESYVNLRPAVCILITDFCMIGNSHCHNRYRLHDLQTGSEFTDLLEINILELPNVPAAATGTDAPLLDWLRFLKAKTTEELNMLAQNNPDIQKAVKRLYELSADETAWMHALARKMQLRDADSWVKDALLLGREEGRTAERKEFARKMLQHAQSLDEIIEMTGLSRQEIEALQGGR